MIKHHEHGLGILKWLACIFWGLVLIVYLSNWDISTTEMMIEFLDEGPADLLLYLF
jgi:hypothetical protein